VYGIDMPAPAELIAHGRTEDEVAELIGADWLVYQTLDDLIESVQYHNADIREFDASCFSGEYVTGDVSEAYLDHIARSRSDAVKEAREREIERPSLAASVI
jgi:amidophosphoribosyltransferase